MSHNSASQRDKSGRTPRPTTKPLAAKRGRPDSSLGSFPGGEMSDLEHEALARQGPPPNRHGDFLENDNLASFGRLGEKLKEKRKKERDLEEEEEREKEKAWARAPAPPTYHSRHDNGPGETSSRRNVASSHRERTPPGTNRKSAPARSEPKTHHPAPPRTDASQLAAALHKDKIPARGKESEDNNVAAMSELNLSGNSSKEPVSNKAGKAPESNAQGRNVKKANYDIAKARNLKKEADAESSRTSKKAESSGTGEKSSGDHRDSKRKRTAGGSS
ncbi:hypothetical protein BCON_0193g00180 [Botryotinia convoluta]|uniref:Uncharacterized protein n=1 Tax=Botryotinia convoluta TaxID=54673 RepID=A0A4Z1HZH3_9HELO|nr:hypothetical protein BCON_0193g00180 [Botryotinia convoluta]